MLRNPDIFKAGQKNGNNIVYYEIDKILNFDYNGDADTLFLDVDKNGSDDIIFISHLSGSPTGYIYSYLFAKGLHDNTIMICDHSNHSDWTSKLLANQQIGNIFKFSNERTILFDYVNGSWDGNDYSFGHFLPITNSYIGFCLIDFDSPVYGWINIDEAGGVHLKSLAYEIDVSNIVKKSHNKSVNLYPNPANDFVYLETGDAHTKDDVNVIIYDIRGLLISEFTFSGSSVKLNISNYPDGIYLCTFKFKDNMSETVRFIVQ
jgi:hypothetical protein